MMTKTIANEDACFGVEFEFVLIIRSEVSQSSTTKDMHKRKFEAYDYTKFLMGTFASRRGLGVY